jgi:hypothetical protein
MIGANAVNAGLADRVGSLERLIIELSSPKTQSPPQEGFFSSTQPKKEKKPMNLEQLKTDHPDLVASLHAEGSAKEKQRLKDILSCEAAEGRQKLAQEIALHTEINAMDAQHLMKSAPKDEPEKITIIFL